MAIEVFNRYENKYMIDEKTFGKLERKLTDYMKLDEYNKLNETYKISNLYYDTDDSRLIRTSLAKPKYKEKLRLRAYGVPDGSSKVYVEIKKKVAGLVNKRRSSMVLSEAYKFLETGRITGGEPGVNRQVISEIEYLLSIYDLKPALYLSYDRRAYFGTDRDDLRISFDRNIQTRRTDLRLESGTYGGQLIEEGKWLMEVKVQRSIPYWLSRVFSEYKIYPTSFSKYGTEYKAYSRKNPAAAKEDIYVVIPNAVPRSVAAAILSN